MARQTIRASMPPINEPIAYVNDEPVYLPEPWRRLFEFLYTAVFFQGTDPTQVLSEGGITLGSGTDGDYVESLTGLTGVSVIGGSGEGSTPTIAIGQAVGTSDSPIFAGATINGNITITGNVDGVDVSALATTVAGKVTKDASITAASESHSLNATFSNTEVETALNDLGAVINEMRTAFNA